MEPKKTESTSAREDRAVIVGSVLRDRKGCRWIVKRITAAAAWVVDYPEVSDQAQLPFMWSAINSLELLGHVSDLATNPRGAA